MHTLIGISGGIGSGKSAICRELEKQGIPIYDTDREAKRLLTEDSFLRQSVVQLLGEDAYEGSTYRTDIVSRKVFARPGLLTQLNRLVWPAVERDLQTWAAGHPVCAVESALLFAAGLHRSCTLTVWVDAPQALRVERAMRRDNASREQIEARIRAQKNEADQADLVLCNDGQTPLSVLAQRILTSLP